VGFYIVPRLIMATGKYLSLPALLPWPWLKLFLGCAIGSGYNFAAGVLFCWLLGVGMTVAGVSFSLWGAQRGLSGNVVRGDTRVRYREGQRASLDAIRSIARNSCGSFATAAPSCRPF